MYLSWVLKPLTPAAGAAVLPPPGQAARAQLIQIQGAGGPIPGAADPDRRTFEIVYIYRQLERPYKKLNIFSILY